MLVAAGLLLSRSIHAQPLLQPAASPFAERLTERVPVSGRTLVGLLSLPDAQPLGDGLSTGSLATGSLATGSLATGSLAVPAPLIVRGHKICVRATTQDGRYSAENSFTAQRDVPREGRADLAWPTQYEAALRTFPLSEVAAVARAGACTGETEIIPVMFGAGTQLGVLQALVNSRGAAITAALRDPETGHTLRRANCTRVSGAARVAFDARCVLGPVADLPALVQLRLEQVSHDGLQVEVLESLPLRLAN